MNPETIDREVRDRDVKLCRACHRVRRAWRPRGLCWSCYYKPGVREQFPSWSKFAVRGVPDKAGRGKLPKPTTAAPGTPEKMAVLAERAANGQRLWHPGDATH